MDPLAKTLHEKALLAAREYRHCEAQLIAILQEIDAHKVFLLLGYPSLFAYAVEELKLSESSALNFITVARKSREIPELKKALEQGEVTVSKARKITPVLTQENAPEWIEKAAHLSKRDLEREVARVLPEPEPLPLLTRSIAMDRVALQLGVSEELMQHLIRVQDLLCQKRREPVSLEKALEAVTREYLERHDPVEKAKRALERKETAQNLKSFVNLHVPGHEQTEEEQFFARFEKEHGRKALLAHLKHQVMYRDQGQCTYLHPNGKRCNQRRWLEVHHILPVAQGGSNRLENLRLLCSAHHKLAHYDLYFKRSHEGLGDQIAMRI